MDTVIPRLVINLETDEAAIVVRGTVQHFVRGPEPTDDTVQLRGNVAAMVNLPEIVARVEAFFAEYQKAPKTAGAAVTLPTVALPAATPPVA